MATSGSLLTESRLDSIEDEDNDECISSFQGIPQTDNDDDSPNNVDFKLSLTRPRPGVQSFDLQQKGKARGRREYSDVPQYLANDADMYDDFHTIDWVRDRNKDKARHDYIHTRGKLSIKGRLSKWFDASSGWIIVLLVGICTGLVAGVVDITAEWMTDLKDGYCHADGGLFYDKRSCCWLSNQTGFDQEDCDLWYTWAYQAGLNTVAAYSTPHYSFDIFDYLTYVTVSLFLALLAGLFTVYLAPYAAGSGIPEVKTILSGFVIKGYFGAVTLLVKSVGVVLAVSAGLSLGKEGPLVHVACCCGNLLVRLFPKYRKNEAKKREVLSAAAAAGVSVAFGAPIGGVLFSLEEASYYFPHKTLWRSFFAALVAFLTLALLNPFYNGSVALFNLNHANSWHLFELIPFAVLGVVGGITGSVFIAANVRWTKFKRGKLSNHIITVAEVILVAFVTGIVNYPNVYTRMGSSEAIRLLFSQCSGEDNSALCQYNRTDVHPDELYHDTQALDPVWNAMWQLLLAGLARGLLTIFTYGIKVPAGLFIPSMFVGACFGRFVGVITEQFAYTYRNMWFIELFCSPKATCVTPGLYAIVGAAASLGGVTRMTVSLVVIMFELTGGLTYIVPIMVAIMLSKWIGDAIVSKGIYDAHIILNGFPFMDSKEEYTLESVAADVMKPQKGDPHLTCLYIDDCMIGYLDHLIRDTEFFGFPCVMSRESMLLAGYITRRDIVNALDKLRKLNDGITVDSLVYFAEQHACIEDTGASTAISLSGYIDTCPTAVSEDIPMERVIELFRKMGLRQILVTKNGKLLGIITKKDVIRHIATTEKRDPENVKFH